MTDNRAELIESAGAAVKKQFRGSISDVASRALEFPSVWASTGSLALDRLCAGTNPGGLPIGKRQGRIVHIYGEWSTGKSLLLDHLFYDVLVRLRGLAKCCETEGSRDPHFAQAIGLPLDLLVIDRPDTIEQAFDMFEAWHEDVRGQDAKIPVIYGFDSLDSTEAEKSAGEGLSKGGGWHYGGGRSEALGVALRRMARVCARYPTSVVLLNQVRDNVGVMFGPKKRTPGGNPPHFYASLELYLKASARPGSGYVRSPLPVPPLSQAAVKRLGLYDLYTDKGKVSERGAVVGRYITARVMKTKMSTTLDTTADFYLDFRKGAHRWEGLAERMMFEGRLSCAKDGASDYVMQSDGAVLQRDGDGGVSGDLLKLLKFSTKKEWLNYVAQHQGEVLSVVREETTGDDEVGEVVGGDVQAVREEAGA